MWNRILLTSAALNLWEIVIPSAMVAPSLHLLFLALPVNISLKRSGIEPASNASLSVKMVSIQTEISVKSVLLTVLPARKQRNVSLVTGHCF